jgi:integrase/recombinase XerD
MSLKSAKTTGARRNVLKDKGFWAATLLAILFRGTGRERRSRNMRPASLPAVSLYSPAGRKYLNARERRRFLASADRMPAKIRLFCLVLARSGGRISETLALTAAAIDLDGGVARLETLKRRRRGITREVPLPTSLLQDISREFDLRARQLDPTLARARLWRWSRVTGWRYVKAVMAAAGITGPAAMPKGLRHAFGVSAFQALVPPHLVQRWLGHASLRTTAIYADVSGPEERAFAAAMWRR